MSCTRREEVVASLATGGPIGRWRAERHAACCPECAAARDELRRVADAMAAVPPLTNAQRQLWAACAGDGLAPERSQPWWLRPALAWALGAAILAVLGAWWASRPVERRPDRPVVATIDPPIRSQGAAREVEGLRIEVVALARELDDLGRRADLLDARKDVEALMARLAPRVGPSGL